MLINPKDIEARLDEILKGWDKIAGDSDDSEEIYQYGDIIYTMSIDPNTHIRLEVDFNIVADMDREDVLREFDAKLDYDPYVKIDVYENDKFVFALFSVGDLVGYLSFYPNKREVC
jgi:hypothetical protein